MAITIKNIEALNKIKEAGNRIARILHDAQFVVCPGISTFALDLWVAGELQRYGLVSCTQGYRDYKHVSCISLNDVVVHGVPSKLIIVRDGDLVKIDICASWQGYCADSARCFFAGNPSIEARRLVDVATNSLNSAIEKAIVGGRLSDISAAIQREVERHGFGVVRDFCGHGIGKSMHEEPEIVNYGKPGRGPVLRSGMVFAIEPMITAKKYDIKIDSDGWTARTVDGSLAAHVEDTVIITDSGPQVVTRLEFVRG